MTTQSIYLVSRTHEQSKHNTKQLSIHILAPDAGAAERAAVAFWQGQNLGNQKPESIVLIATNHQCPEGATLLIES